MTATLEAAFERATESRWIGRFLFLPSEVRAMGYPQWRPEMGGGDLLACSRCKQVRWDQEIVLNFGVCDECLEEGCPCTRGRPFSCPLHERPDVVLELG